MKLVVSIWSRKRGSWRLDILGSEMYIAFIVVVPFGWLQWHLASS